MIKNLRSLNLTLFFLGSSLSFLLPQSGHALEFGCMISPEDIPQVATRILKKVHDQKKPFPNTVNTQTFFQGNIHSPNSDPSNEPDGMDATFEGFFRPLDDLQYSFFALPFLEFQFTRQHDLVYICGHGDRDPKKTHLTLYVLSGYSLDPWSISTPFEDYFHPNEISFGSVQVEAIGIRDKVPLFPILERIPVLGQIVRIPDEILGKINNAFGEAITLPAGAHIQRMVLTTDYIELDSGFDPKNPDEATKFFRFDFGTQK